MLQCPIAGNVNDYEAVGRRAWMIWFRGAGQQRGVVGQLESGTVDGHTALEVGAFNSARRQLRVLLHRRTQRHLHHAPLGTEVKLSPGHIALDPAPPLKGHCSSPSFRPVSIVNFRCFAINIEITRKFNLTPKRTYLA